MNTYRKSQIPPHLLEFFEPAEIGLEPTPDEFVAKLVTVFREVRRVLRDDGTLWLNIGDSYNAAGRTGHGTRVGYKQGSNRASSTGADACRPSVAGLKEKDLIGVPWMLAKALREPYYTGQIKDEAARVWLAAIIDGEGCFFIHKRKAGSSAHSKFVKADGTESNYTRTADTYGVGLEICNTSKPIIDRIMEIIGGTVTTQSPAQNNRRKQTIYRVRVAPNEAKRIAQEVYPHLVGKQHQARLIFNCPSTGDAGAAAHQAMMDLHNGVQTSVDYPPPPSLFEPGWYLRQDVIWAKSNPMPESVTDRCTKSHEYIFLLAKSPTYYCDMGAIKEPAVGQNHHDLTSPGYKAPGQAPNTGNRKALRTDIESRHRSQIQGGQSLMAEPDGRRNKRSVWTVSTKPYSGAHFATFPEDLIEPCILAGAPAGGVVLDPFFGSGTTGQVAQALGRQFIGIELNEAYKPLQDERLRQPSLLLEAA